MERAVGDARRRPFRTGSGNARAPEKGTWTPANHPLEYLQQALSPGTLVESGPLRDFSDALVATVTVDEAHPMVSLVAMVAPSPEWFTGVANVNLIENGLWVPSRTLELTPYDSGGDDGTTYKAADRANNPKKRRHPKPRCRTTLSTV